MNDAEKFLQRQRQRQAQNVQSTGGGEMDAHLNPSARQAETISSTVRGNPDTDRTQACERRSPPVSSSNAGASSPKGLLIIAGIVVLGLICLGLYALYKEQERYDYLIQVGNKYLLEQRYDEARNVFFTAKKDCVVFDKSAAEKAINELYMMRFRINQ